MEPVVYWEKQDPKTKMCALHCLNSLLQGPLVTADELCEISLILDSKENMLLNNSGSHGYNERVLGYGNVSESGDFNLPVSLVNIINRSTHCVGSTKCTRETEYLFNHSMAFICNIQAHWFSVRNVHGEWYVLDSLRDGPVPVEPGWLHDYIKETLEGNKGGVMLVIPNNGRLPEPEPFRYTRLQPYQFFLKTSELGQNSFDHEERKSFLFKDGENKTKEVVWPTSGGIRLDQSLQETQTNGQDDEYYGSDAIKVAVKLVNNDRLTKSFSPNYKVKKLFEWLEHKCDLKKHDFYFLLQTVPFRKFIKYSNGSIELLKNDAGPSDVTNETFSKLDFGSHDMFMLRLE